MHKGLIFCFFVALSCLTSHCRMKGTSKLTAGEDSFNCSSFEPPPDFVKISEEALCQFQKPDFSSQDFSPLVIHIGVPKKFLVKTFAVITTQGGDIPFDSFEVKKATEDTNHHLFVFSFESKTLDEQKMAKYGQWLKKMKFLLIENKIRPLLKSQEHDDRNSVHIIPYIDESKSKKILSGQTKTFMTILKKKLEEDACEFFQLPDYEDGAKKRDAFCHFRRDKIKGYTLTADKIHIAVPPEEFFRVFTIMEELHQEIPMPFSKYKISKMSLGLRTESIKKILNSLSQHHIGFKKLDNHLYTQRYRTFSGINAFTLYPHNKRGPENFGLLNDLDAVAAKAQWLAELNTRLINEGIEKSDLPEEIKTNDILISDYIIGRIERTKKGLYVYPSGQVKKVNGKRRNSKAEELFLEEDSLLFKEISKTINSKD